VDLDGTILVSRTAYQAMLQRGAGHIVTVASLAGLVPLPGLAYYSAAKHAVVAFSLALRAEARPYGVRVSVACPALVDTPLRANTAAYLERPVFPAPRLRWPRPISADRCALAILRGVARNAAVIPVPAYAGWIWLMYRLAPDWIAGLAAAGRRMRRPYDEG
jgi:short-subunit dehydrogenase